MKLKINDLALENNNFKLQKEHEKEFKSLKLNFQQLIEENKKLKAQNVDRINVLEKEIKKVSSRGVPKQILKSEIKFKK